MIESWQIRAAREACKWSQGRLAKKAGTTQPYISKLEKDEVDRPSAEILQNLEKTFNAEGVYFPPDGLQLRRTNAYTIEGPDCYLKLLDDIHRTLAESKEEWLLSASDERRCTTDVIEKTRTIRKDGIAMRSLMKNGDTFLMGPVEEYRWMPDELFVEGDVKIIFGDRVAYLVTWTETPRIIVIQDRIIATESRRMFDFLWKLSEKPTHSTSEISYEGRA